MRPIHVLGIGAEGIDGLSRRARSAIAEASFLAGGKRQLHLIGAVDVETFVIGDNIPALIDRLKSRGSDERTVVLASGDPLCFGIGGTLRRELPAEDLVIEPTVSSLQLAFARAGIPWEGAAIVSIHGRALDVTLLPLLGRPTIGLFTQDGESPGRVASFFLDRGLCDYDAWVCDDLGSASERVGRFPISDLPGRKFSSLNFMILRRSHGDQFLDLADAIRDDEFRRPEIGPLLLTHSDVRAVTLSRFRGLPEGPIWDIGAGLGGISIDLARRFPNREVVAVERSPVQITYLKENRLQFAAYNLRIIEGVAPESLAQHADPTAVFLGGSGGNLDAILDFVFQRLRARGVFVANFVGLENLSRTLDRLRSVGWQVEATQVQISHAEPLAGLTTFVPLRPVWVVRSVRPESGVEAP